MNLASLQELAWGLLERMCVHIPHRRVGSPGNLEAVDIFAELMENYGYKVEKQWFDCYDWKEKGALLSVGEVHFNAKVSPYSLGCDHQAPLRQVSSLDELREVQEGSILLLRGDIAKEQLMPKNFPFYNPENHQRILQALEESAPLAIITATGRNPELAGGMYPFPLIEDGDFDIPSVYMTDVEGDMLAELVGESVSIRIDSMRIPAKGCNVSARIEGSSEERIVCCAHIDSKQDTPGALDNATGVVTLLLLAKLAREYKSRLGLEILALNGEDHYSAAGEIEFLRRAGDQISNVWLAINLDSPGYKEGKTAYSLYGCPKNVEKTLRQVFERYPDIISGDPWYQSDHSIFIQNGRPAVAITSEQLQLLTCDITHTPLDQIDLVDPRKLVELAEALHVFISA